MAATVMTVEFGTIHLYSSLKKNSVSALGQIQKSTEYYVNCDILV